MEKIIQSVISVIKDDISKNINKNNFVKSNVSNGRKIKTKTRRLNNDVR